MKRSSMLLALVLMAAPVSQIHADASIPAEFQALFNQDDPRVALDMDRLEEELAVLLGRTSLSSEDQARLSAALIKIVDAAREGQMIEAWKACEELRILLQELKAKQDQVTTRGFFDVIGAVVELIGAVRDGDFLGILKALWTIISSLD